MLIYQLVSAVVKQISKYRLFNIILYTKNLFEEYIQNLGGEFHSRSTKGHEVSFVLLFKWFFRQTNTC